MSEIGVTGSGGAGRATERPRRGQDRFAGAAVQPDFTPANLEVWWRIFAVLLFFGGVGSFRAHQSDIQLVNPLFMVPPLELRHTCPPVEQGILLDDLKTSMTTAFEGYVHRLHDRRRHAES